MGTIVRQKGIWYRPSSAAPTPPAQVRTHTRTTPKPVSPLLCAVCVRVTNFTNPAAAKTDHPTNNTCPNFKAQYFILYMPCRLAACRPLQQGLPKHPGFTTPVNVLASMLRFKSPAAHKQRQPHKHKSTFPCPSTRPGLDQGSFATAIVD
ncbi:hypothetical protein P280DRAFT_3051 [Massarina eburnea CBS 473.64]|uniref:Uncharacterized protein n=1 Tax=Massarina eburnea CBS 473.64 TaxID=1395130 RepID=A0A6A6SE92_9PLEO|nr:hypothetical protein P280DRAFT_3051 [Massarina eburnea CBS 473.64]